MKFLTIFIKKVSLFEWADDIPLYNSTETNFLLQWYDKREGQTQTDTIKD